MHAQNAHDQLSRKDAHHAFEDASAHWASRVIRCGNLLGEQHLRAVGAEAKMAAGHDSMRPVCIAADDARILYRAAGDESWAD